MSKHSIKSYLCSGYPVIWVQTHEVDRCIASLVETYTSRPSKRWDSVRGCEGFDPKCKDPFAFVQALVDPKQSPKGMVYFAVNFHLWLDAQQGRQTLQALKNALPIFKTNEITLVVVSPVVKIPVELERDIVLVDFGLPTTDELERVLVKVEGYANGEKPNEQHYYVPADKREAVLEAARGLTWSEAEDAFSLAYVTDREIKPQTVSSLKAQMVEKNASLEFAGYTETFTTLGGLGNWKEWCLNRFKNRKMKHFDNAPALPFRGCLALGVPGTGKSHFAKALSNEVGWPCIELDMGKMFGSLVGESEQKMRDALAVIDAMSPVILFIDEIEKGLAGVGSAHEGDSGTTKRVGGTFLQWLQNHTSEVFVIATCNNLAGLPAEYTRLGRWDGIFFVDVPTPKEAKEIASIYTKMYFDKEVKEVKDFPELVNYTGAEIRQVVVEAAYNGGDFRKAAKFVVPQFKAQEKAIKELREKAENCWIPASLSESSKIWDKVDAKRSLEVN
jgi:hypothetical protein